MIRRVAMLGCGAMGSAMIHGIELSRRQPQVLAFDPQPDLARSRLGASAADVTGAIGEVLAFDPDVLILAIKPQVMSGAADQFADLTRDRWVISMAAGVTSKTLRSAFPTARGVTRIMPNLAVARGQGMTVMVAGPDADEEQTAAIERMLSGSGRVARVASDAQLDVATAISGSGPAYFFAVAQMMARAAERQGLDAALARDLAAQTLAGAGVLADDFGAMEALKRAVQSPGGTTAAALAVIEGPAGADSVIDAAVEAAVRRARELAR